MSTPVVNAFSAHALTFLYDVHGYDVLLHELEMIHYLRTRSFAPSAEKQEAEKEEPVKEKGKKKDANTKTVVISEKHAVASASKAVDESRCIALVGKDQHQCSVRANKKLSGEMRLCKKHYLLATTNQKETSSVASSSHEEAEEDEEEDE